MTDYFIYKNFSCFPVPPKKPMVHDSNGRKMVEKLGPFKVGDDLSATCVTVGGERIKFLKDAPFSASILCGLIDSIPLMDEWKCLSMIKLESQITGISKLIYFCSIQLNFVHKSVTAG